MIGMRKDGGLCFMINSFGLKNSLLLQLSVILSKYYGQYELNVLFGCYPNRESKGTSKKSSEWEQSQYYNIQLYTVICSFDLSTTWKIHLCW